jgi:hypothetical protein
MTALAVIVASPTAFAQVTSSGISGSVRDAAGTPIAGASVTATHIPTNSAYNATTNASGRYNLRSLIVGGPYTILVEADGFRSTQQAGVTTALGSEIDVSFAIQSVDIVTLEAFTVEGLANELDGGALGSGVLLGQQVLTQKPSSERSIADIVSASPLVTLRETFGDREESQITALGQNNRYNSVLIDGARINDSFGLNGTGLASFFNPLSLDAVEQISVDVSPYDVRYAGFTGAAINAVTKSGTNEFKGSAYYYFRGDELFGLQLQGENARDRVLNDRKVVPTLERRTMGLTFGGPILKDRLFFFLNYEDFQSTSTGRDPRFSTPQETTILARLQQYSTASGTGIDWGSPVTEQTSNTAVDEKIIAKVDWAITPNQRFSIRYSKTEGEVPQFGRFASSSSSFFGPRSTLRGGVATSPDGSFYSQQRVEESYAAQLFSQWSDNFKTEIKYSQTQQDQLTPLNATAPEVFIFGVSGTDLSNGRAVTNGAYIAGTEQFRHGNVIDVANKQFTATGDYFWNDWVFSGGVEREWTDYFNLFRQGSFGQVGFPTVADFLADTNAAILRNAYDPKIRNVADVSDFATTGIFAQGKWDVNPRLQLLFGLRYEFAETDKRPPLNQAFLTTTGFRNDGTVDGSDSISPRLGFNLALDDERRMQLRGGLGHFRGRAPWVIFSNSFGQTGVGAFQLNNNPGTGTLPATFEEYLRTSFDPASPIGTGTDNPSLVREINWADDGVQLPAVWRANLALDRRLDFLDTTFSVEIVHTAIDEALFIVEENIVPTTRGADGRQRFAGSATSNGRRFAGYRNLLRVTNTDVGESTYFTATWARPTKDKWGFSLSYTRGDSTEAQGIGQTTAGGQWNRNVVFNQNTPEAGTSEFEIKDRLQLTLSREFEFIRNFPTTVSLYYEGRTGNPYSWVYSSDLNNDGRNDNDTVAVPDGVGDARFDFSGMTAETQATYFAFIERSGLGAYAGGIAPKNAWTEPWVNRLDLKFAQVIPLAFDAKLSLFADFINFGSFLSESTFGYTEVAPSISNGVFRRRSLGGATYGTDGRIRPTYTGEPSGFNLDNGMSRWRIQLGAKLEF